MTTFKLVLALVILSLFGTTAVAQTTTNCKPGYSWDNMRETCWSKCSADKTWNDSTSSCVSVCKPGYSWVSDTQSCASKCSGGQVWITGANACECTGGTIWEPDQKLCLKGSEIVEARKLTALQKAAAAKTTAAKIAEEKANECPEGTSRDYHTQQCVSMCKASLGSTRGPGTWNMREHQCDCPTGTSWSSLGGGSCRPAN